MSFSSKSKLIPVLILSVLFGVAMSIIKGNDAGVRDTIGNLCAPWMLLPFLSSVWLRKGIFQSAFIGLIVSICALVGFYFTNSFVLDLGRDSWLADIQLTMRSGVFYYRLSLVSGPVFGILGGIYIRDMRSRVSLLIGLAMAGLFVLEPIVFSLYEEITNSELGFSSFLYFPLVATGECLLGGVIGVVVIIKYQSANKKVLY